MRLYDTHIHLSDPEYGADLDTIVLNMRRTHTRACCVSTGITDSARTLEISEEYGPILPFVGIHPERARDDIDAMEAMIRQNADRIAGIGEIGLDSTLCRSDGDHTRQKTAFERMLRLAEEYGKPISIHSRGSLDDVLDIMGSYSVRRAALHWFDGNKKQLRRATDAGLFVSYGPVMVYANDKQGLLARTGRDSILVETDGPVRFARCFGSRAARPDFIPSVVFAASKALGMTYDETCAILEGNSERFLGM